MYQIKNYQTGVIIEETLKPRWIKQQKKIDSPSLCDTQEEADGVVLSDRKTMLGIEGRNMQNYTPTVTVEKVDSDPYIFAELDSLKEQINSVQSGVNAVHTYQTEETVLRSELDAAYAQGVNTV